MITRKEALILLNNYLQTNTIRKHSYAVEAIMKKTASFLHKDENLWGIVGLLHDIDYEYTANNPQQHGTVSADLLINLLPTIGINAIKGHNHIHTDYIPTTSIDKALIASDALSGLIIATALVMPQKKLQEVTIESLTKKMKDKSFAKGCDRKRIRLCQDFGIEEDVFLQIGLSALQEIHDTLGL